MESHLRSIAKTISWRCLAAVCTGLIAWSITGSFYLGITIGLSDTFIKLVIYYLHERGWQRVRWGLTYPGPKTLTGDGEGI